VKNGFDAGESRANGGAVVERGADETDAAFFQVGCRRAREHGDRPAVGEEAFDEAPAEEAGAAGHERGRARE